MSSDGNNFNYFSKNKLTKLANFVQLMFCLEDLGGWAPCPRPLGYATAKSTHIKLSDIRRSIIFFVPHLLVLHFYSPLQVCATFSCRAFSAFPAGRRGRKRYRDETGDDDDERWRRAFERYGGQQLDVISAGDFYTRLLATGIERSAHVRTTRRSVIVDLNSSQSQRQSS